MSKRIGEALLEKGFITRDQLARALRLQLIFGGTLGTCLLELGYTDEAALGRTLSEITGMKCARAEMFDDIPEEILEAIPVDEVRKRQVIPIGVDGKSLHVAVTDRQSLTGLSSTTGYKIVPYLAPQMRILLAMEHFYGIPRRPRYLKVPSESLTGKPADSHREAPRRGSPVADADAPKVSAEQPHPALADLSRRMSSVTNHGELGELIVDFVTEQMPRCILFEVNEEDAGVANWKGVDLDPQQARQISIPVHPDSLFALAAEAQCFRGELPNGIYTEEFYGRLGIDAPREVLILPIYGDERLEAVLYADGGEVGEVPGPSQAYLELLDQIGLALKMLSYRMQLASR